MVMRRWELRDSIENKYLYVDGERQITLTGGKTPEKDGWSAQIYGKLALRDYHEGIDARPKDALLQIKENLKYWGRWGVATFEERRFFDDAVRLLPFYLGNKERYELELDIEDAIEKAFRKGMSQDEIRSAILDWLTDKMMAIVYEDSQKPEDWRWQEHIKDVGS